MKIIIISGLPGSGKTTLAQNLCQENDYILDDLSVLLREAQLPLNKMKELIITQKNIDTLIITDVATCVAQSQKVLHHTLQKLFTQSEQQWIFFLPNVKQSLINHEQRQSQSQSLQRDVVPSIYNMAKLFSIHPEIEHLSQTQLTHGVMGEVMNESHQDNTIQLKTGLKKDIR